MKFSVLRETRRVHPEAQWGMESSGSGTSKAVESRGKSDQENAGPCQLERWTLSGGR